MYDRDVAELLSTDGELVYEWSFPSDLKVQRLALNSHGDVLASTARHGILLFNRTGGLIGQLSDTPKSIAMNDKQLFMLDGEQLMSAPIPRSAPIAWFNAHPVTAMDISDTGELVFGDSEGRVLSPSQSWMLDQFDNVNRNVWFTANDRVLINTIASKGIGFVDRSGHFTAFSYGNRQLRPYGDGCYLGLLWNEGIRSCEWLKSSTWSLPTLTFLAQEI